MAWFKADDRLLGHWKFLGIDNDTLGTWFRCGVWSAQQVTDGFVPDVVLEAFTTPEVVDNLVRRGLWTAEDGGIRFHDWAEYQPTKAEQDGKRQAERDRKRKQRRGSNGKFTSPDDVPDDCDDFNGPDETDVPHMSQWDTTGQADSPSGTERPSESVRRTRPDPTRPDPTRTEPVSPNGETRRESHPPVEAPSRRVTYPPAFQAFWDAYPKHKDKKAALKAWKQATKEVPNDTLIDAALAYAKDENRDPQYTKHPATWLNAGAWDDQPDQPTPHNISMWDYLPEAGGDAA